MQKREGRIYQDIKSINKLKNTSATQFPGILCKIKVLCNSVRVKLKSVFVRLKVFYLIHKQSLGNKFQGNNCIYCAPPPKTDNHVA